MKLLFDENLSPRLVRAIADEFPDSSHFTSLGLAGTSDYVIWEYAQTHGYTVVSKDDDFRSLSLVNGAPPKVTKSSGFASATPPQPTSKTLSVHPCFG